MIFRELIYKKNCWKFLLEATIKLRQTIKNPNRKKLAMCTENRVKESIIGQQSL
jgi:hypothetical protein